MGGSSYVHDNEHILANVSRLFCLTSCVCYDAVADFSLGMQADVVMVDVWVVYNNINYMVSDAASYNATVDAFLETGKNRT